MEADPTEKLNLADARPEKLAEMRATLAAVDGQMVPSAWPSLIEGPIAIDHPLPIPDNARVVAARLRSLAQGW